MKLRKEILLMTAVIWIVLSFVNGDYQLAGDGYLHIGFPFPIYREFNGNCDVCLPQGILIKNLAIDLFILGALNILINLLLSLKKKKNE